MQPLSQGSSPCAQNGLLDSQQCDYPLPSIERGVAILAIDSASLAGLPTLAHGNSTPSFDFAKFQAEDYASGLRDGGGLSTPTNTSVTPSFNFRFAGIDAEEQASVVSDTGGSPTPAREGSVTSLSSRLAGLQVKERASEPTDHRSSLFPVLKSGRDSTRPSHRRSSSHPPVKCHEVDDEEPPASTFHSRDFQDALTHSKDLAKRLAGALSSGNIHTDQSSAVSGLYTQAKEASIYCGQRNWKIGFVGDSGAGKSHLINSLLDRRHLAWTNNSGTACTCAATEYRYHDSPQYTIEVAYFPKHQLLDQFKNHLQAYRRFHLKSTEDVDEGIHFREAASVAWDTFIAAFHGQASLTKAYLLQSDEQMVWDNVSSWVEEWAPTGYPQTGTAPSTHRESAPDLESCSNLLKRLTSHTSEANAAASWPYIERVKVFLRASILSEGVILVDLPGLHDINSARRQITERYITECDEVFAIASIGRAITDAGLEAVIDLAKKTQRKHVGIICTKSDVINVEEAERDLTGEAQNTSKRLRKSISDAKDYLDSIKHDMRFLDNGFDADPAELSQLIKELKTEEDRLRDDEYRLQQHLVMIRNARVSVELCRKYRDVLPERFENRHVFCIGNNFYWDYRERDRKIALRWLQLSGIISLRRHCLGLVAAHHLRDASAFMEHTIPSLVSSIDLWVQLGSGKITDKTRTRVREAAREVERLLQRELAYPSSPSNRISITLDSHLGQWIRNRFTNGNRNAWMAIAREATHDWRSVAPASYAAFCRKYGDHTVRGSPPKCWNQDIIRGMMSSFNEPWTRFLASVSETFRQRRNTLRSLFEQGSSLLEKATDHEDLDRDSFETMQALITTLEHRKFLLYAETLGIATECQADLARLGNSGFLSVIRTSFIGQHMEMAYQTAAQDSGNGVTRRRQYLIEGHVAETNMFLDIQAKLELHFGTLAHNVEEKIRAANKKHFLATRSALDTLRNENAVLEAERDPEFRENMREEVINAQRALLTIAAVVLAAKQPDDIA